MSFTQTSTYRAPALAYTAVSGTTVNGSTPNPTVIPLTLEQYSGVNARGTLVQLQTMPIVNEDNFAYGGTAMGEGPTELPRVSMSGFINTPMTGTTSSVQINGNSVTYADYIIMCLEGRVSQTWQRYDPLWFRDPFGRQFDTPRIIDFSASYVEAVPGRTSFSMTLLVR